MNYLDPKPLNDIPEHVQSGSNFPIKEKIADGYNTYDNVLRLVDIREITVNVPALTFNFDGTASYTYSEILTHTVGQTPFIDIEWRDPSSVGSGETNIITVSVEYNTNFIVINYSQNINRFGSSWGEPPVFPDTDPVTYEIRIFVYKLNTKRRLDTYVK